MKLTEIFDIKKLTQPQTLPPVKSLSELKQTFGRFITQERTPQKTPFWRIEIGDQIMQTSDNELTLYPFKENEDFKWRIAMGDDKPHAIDIYNPQMFNDPDVLEILSSIAGESPY